MVEGRSVVVLAGGSRRDVDVVDCQSVVSEVDVDGECLEMGIRSVGRGSQLRGLDGVVDVGEEASSSMGGAVFPVE